jgi:hypothetical protein
MSASRPEVRVSCVPGKPGRDGGTLIIPAYREDRFPVERITMSDTTAAPKPIFDKPEQLEKIRASLLQGEFIIAVYDSAGAGTGFIGLTNKRFIIQDNSFVGGRIALTSIPYSRVANVSLVSDKSMMGKFFSSSTISISTGGGIYSVTFRGAEKAKHAHDVILWSILSETNPVRM